MSYMAMYTSPYTANLKSINLLYNILPTKVCPKNLSIFLVDEGYFSIKISLTL